MTQLTSCMLAVQSSAVLVAVSLPISLGTTVATLQHYNTVLYIPVLHYCNPTTVPALFQHDELFNLTHIFLFYFNIQYVELFFSQLHCHISC